MFCSFSLKPFVFSIGKKADGNEDDIPSSAVDLQVKERVSVMHDKCYLFRLL